MLPRLQKVLSGMGRAGIGVLVVLVLAAAQANLLRFPLGESVDRLVHDLRLRMLTVPADPRVVIVDIDESSLAELGRWPWERGILAKLIGNLTEKGGAAVVGVDIVFAESQREAGQDDALAAALASRPVVLGYYFTSDRGGRASGALPSAVMRAETLPHGVRPLSWDGYGASIEPLQRAARGAGFFNPVIDPDGVVRALPLLGEYRGGLYESLSVAVLRQYLGGAALGVTQEHLVLQGSRGAVRIPLSTGLTALVPFSSTPVAEGVAPSLSRVGSTSGRFRYVSAADVIAGRSDPALFRDRIVLVGTSAPGLTDLRATPLSAAFPGVEIHALLLSGALDHAAAPAIRVRSSLVDAAALVIMVLLGVVLAVAMPLLGAPGVLGLGALTAAGVWTGAAIAWSNLGLVAPVANGLIAVAALMLLNLSLGYLIEGRARRAVAILFGEYVSPALVERMMRDPRRYSRAASETRELTILFVDIRGFTRMAETMDPAPLREYINSFLTAMTEVVHRHGGTLDKYIGDAVMAFWGAPIADERHADHAVAAALGMLDEVERLNRDFEQKGMPLLSVGVGVNSGLVRVGDLGSTLRRAYTVIGDPVNLASRFEALTKQYDAPIIVGEATVRLASGHRFRELGRARVSGREEPVRVFAPASVGAQRGHTASPVSSQTDSSASACDAATDRGETTGQALVDEGSGIRL